MMKFFRSIIIIVVIVFSGWSLKKFLFEEDTHQRGPAERFSSQETVSEQVRSFSISGFSESGEKSWNVEGKTADIMAEVINLHDVNADSYGEDVEVNLKADSGVFYRANNNIELEKRSNIRKESL